MSLKRNYFSEMSVPKPNQTGGTGTKVCSAHAHQEQEGVIDIPGDHRTAPTSRLFESQKCL